AGGGAGQAHCGSGGAAARAGSAGASGDGDGGAAGARATRGALDAQASAVAAKSALASRRNRIEPSSPPKLATRATAVQAGRARGRHLRQSRTWVPPILSARNSAAREYKPRPRREPEVWSLLSGPWMRQSMSSVRLGPGADTSSAGRRRRTSSQSRRRKRATGDLPLVDSLEGSSGLGP